MCSCVSCGRIFDLLRDGVTIIVEHVCP